jgi:hypothetical protein
MQRCNSLDIGLRATAAAIWFASSVSAQTAPPQTNAAQTTTTQTTAFDTLPKPGCNSYAMQTLERKRFGIEQRTCYWASQLLTGTATVGASFFGALDEWEHKPKEWPQGWVGFGDRFGTNYTQSMVKSTATFLVSAITREDPRDRTPPITAIYSNRRGCKPPTSFKGRLGHALLRTVWDMCEEGMRGFAPGRLAGSFASGFVGLAWAPPSQNTISHALEDSGTAFGGYVINSVFSEFQYNIFGLLGKLFPAGKPAPGTPPPPPTIPNGAAR